MLMREKMEAIIEASNNRVDLCTQLIRDFDLRNMLEVGVFRGDFAKGILTECTELETYYMIDPWRNLEDWNKPANKSDDVFAKYLDETMRKTEFASKKRKVLQGKTKEVIDSIPDASLDIAYIDGDHTLKGISIDLALVWPKIKEGGFVVGDDFTANVFQHGLQFEPTLVFPYAIYFAEAVDVKIYGMPFNQFVICKNSEQVFEFIDLTNGVYQNQDLSKHLQISGIAFLKNWIKSKIKRF